MHYILTGYEFFLLHMGLYRSLWLTFYKIYIFKLSWIIFRAQKQNSLFVSMLQ